MVSMRVMITVLLLGATLTARSAEPVKITPSHVFQLTEEIFLLGKQIRNHAGISTSWRVPGVQSGKMPIHVYGKGIEVAEKVARIQQESGLIPMAVQAIPLRKVTPAEVFGAMVKIREGLQQVAEKRNITASIDTVPLVPGKTPSDVYSNVWRTSYLLDALAGPLNPSKVFRNVKVIQEEIKQIAARLQKSTAVTEVSRIDGKRPEDVNIVAFRALYRVALLQRKLGMKVLDAPRFPSGKITPSDVYDSTNLIKAELVRIKVDQGVTTPQAEVPEESGKTPSDVYQQMRRVEMMLQQL